MGININIISRWVRHLETQEFSSGSKRETKEQKEESEQLAKHVKTAMAGFKGLEAWLDMPEDSRDTPLIMNLVDSAYALLETSHKKDDALFEFAQMAVRLDRPDCLEWLIKKKYSFSAAGEGSFSTRMMKHSFGDRYEKRGHSWMNFCIDHQAYKSLKLFADQGYFERANQPLSTKEQLRYLLFKSPPYLFEENGPLAGIDFEDLPLWHRAPDKKDKSSKSKKINKKELLSSHEMEVQDKKQLDLLLSVKRTDTTWTWEDAQILADRHPFFKMLAEDHAPAPKSFEEELQLPKYALNLNFKEPEFRLAVASLAANGAMRAMDFAKKLKISPLEFDESIQNHLFKNIMVNLDLAMQQQEYPSERKSKENAAVKLLQWMDKVALDPALALNKKPSLSDQLLNAFTKEFETALKGNSRTSFSFSSTELNLKEINCLLNSLPVYLAQKPIKTKVFIGRPSDETIKESRTALTNLLLEHHAVGLSDKNKEEQRLKARGSAEKWNEMLTKELKEEPVRRPARKL